MTAKLQKEKILRKNAPDVRSVLHDIRGHLSVILSAGEVALLEESSVTREDALAVIKTTVAEVDAIMEILSEMKG